MLIIEMNMVKSMFLAIIMLYIGNAIRNKVTILKKWSIPGPVVGGLLFSILTMVLYMNNVVTFEFDTTLQTLFMNLFFAATGFEASIPFIRKSGKNVIIFVVLAALLAFLQNVVAVVLGPIVGIEPSLALMTGSIPMTGGHGNAAAFGPVAEAAGVTGAVSVSIAAATFGLVAGSLIGGPIANYLIRKDNLLENYDPNAGDDSIDGLADEGQEIIELENSRISTSLFLLFIAIGIGAFLQDLNTRFFPSVSIPIHVWGMVGGLIIRNVYDLFLVKRGAVLPNAEVEMMGNAFLSMFVSSAVMTMKLWQLIDLAIPLIVLLLAQVLLIIPFVIFLTYRVTGKNYDAALISAGHVGFGMGAVPVAMANMQAVSDKYYYSKAAFFVVPIVGGLFSNFTNAAIITLFFNITGI